MATKLDFFFVRDEARLLLAWGKQGERNLDGENVCLALFYLPTTSQVIVVVSILAVKKAGHEVAGTPRVVIFMST